MKANSSIKLSTRPIRFGLKVAAFGIFLVQSMPVSASETAQYQTNAAVSSTAGRYDGLGGAYNTGTGYNQGTGYNTGYNQGTGYNTGYNQGTGYNTGYNQGGVNTGYNYGSNGYYAGNGYGQGYYPGGGSFYPGTGAPGYGVPGYGTPGMGMPGYGVPGYGTPGMGMPGYGMGAGQFVDENWITDQLRFIKSDVDQNRIYNAHARIQQIISYIRTYGDSNLMRRLYLAANLRNKEQISMEVNGILTDWSNGQLSIGWGGNGNQTFPGQQDIDKGFLLQQLNQIIMDFPGNSSNARVRLQGLIASVPPTGNERLIRRLMYASSIQDRTVAANELSGIVQEINSGSLVLNDTTHMMPGYGTYPGYYGGQPGYGMPGYGTPGYGMPGYGTPGYGTPGYGTPGYGTTYPGGYGAGYGYGGGFPTSGYYGYSSASTGGEAPVASQPAVQTPAVVAPLAPTDLAALQDAVNKAYQELTQAIATGDAARIKAARDAYTAAQKKLEEARQ